MHRLHCRNSGRHSRALSLWAVATAAAQAPEKFTFALNWFAVGDHAAYWVALDKGYFTQQGPRRHAGEFQGLGRLRSPRSIPAALMPASPTPPS